MPASAEVPVANQREWGRAVAADRKGRGRVFVRSVSQGVDQTTFVTWIDPEDR
jgi:hypothetical protein